MTVQLFDRGGAIRDDIYYSLNKMVVLTPMTAVIFYDKPLLGAVFSVSVITISFLATSFFNLLAPEEVLQDEEVRDYKTLAGTLVGVVVSHKLFRWAGFSLR